MMPKEPDDFNELSKFFEELLAGPPGRPKHPDFMKLSAIVLRHDGPTNDPTTKQEFSFEDTVNRIINIDALTYMAQQRVQIFLQQLRIPADLRLVAAMSSAWIDAFMVGAEWQKEKNDA